MNQAELCQMTEERIRDAKALLDGGRWEFAYYVAGYAVECGLKSCILSRMVRTAWVFQEKWDARKCLTHDFTDLVELADLQRELAANKRASAPPGRDFVKYWDTVQKWKVSSRYESKSEAEARDLYEAITNDPNGVLLWIRNFW